MTSPELDDELLELEELDEELELEELLELDEEPLELDELLLELDEELPELPVSPPPHANRAMLDSTMPPSLIVRIVSDSDNFTSMELPALVSSLNYATLKIPRGAAKACGRGHKFSGPT